MTRQIEEARKLIRQARSIVGFTGAGVSVPSGIPDFRSPGSGLWEKYDPFEVATFDSFLEHPGRFYDWIRPLLSKAKGARPNPAHEAFARLERSGRFAGLVTQNIDGLHELAGSEKVLPVHGHTRSVSCVRCGHSVPSDEVWDIVEAGEVPRCRKCSGLQKPDVVLFGEILPIEVMEEARSIARKADLVLAAGSSLEVFPANEIPRLTLASGGILIIVNLGPTPLDRQATLKIEGDVAEVLPELV